MYMRTTDRTRRTQVPTDGYAGIGVTVAAFSIEENGVGVGDKWCMKSIFHGRDQYETK